MTTTTLHRTQIYLSNSQQATLGAMARAQRSTSSALIREAIDSFIAVQPVQQNRALRMRAAGQWQPDNARFKRVTLDELRSEERRF
ncbi:MAG: ribbon-helix-helix protein, CopG family [Cytophagales bacterium]|nr:ribbon-helix-helix protein, CopG family [Cytophagales bacterium]